MLTKTKEDWKVIAECIINHTNEKYNAVDVRVLIETCKDVTISDDFCLEFDGAEYRIIKDYAIWDIYVEEIKQITLDCYLCGHSSVSNYQDGHSEGLPWWIELDWEATAQNTIIDGYGHNFAGYDHEESELNGYWVFRIN